MSESNLVTVAATPIGHRGGTGIDRLVGRDAEIAAVAAVLSSTSETPALVVRGPQGIGKSAVVEAAWRASGRPTLRRLTFDRQLRSVPLGGVLAALDRNEREAVQQLLDPVSYRAGVDRRLHVALSALEILAPPSEPGQPIVVEHPHAADDLSLVLLRALLRSMPDRRAPLIVVTDTTDEFTAVLDRQPWSSSLEITPLGADDIVTLAEHCLGRPPGAGLREVLDSAGGHPLLVLQLLESLRPTLLVGDDGTIELPGDGTAGSIAELVARRLRLRTPEYRHVVRVMAVIGSTASLEELVAASQARTHEVVAALEEAAEDGLIDWRDDHVVFRHASIQRAVLDSTPAALATSIHLELARRIDDPRDAARRYLAAGRAGGVEAGHALAQAGRSMLGTSPTSAADLLAAAVDVLPVDDPLHGEVLRDQAEALLWLGTPRQAEEIIRRAITSPWCHDDLVAELRVGLGWCLVAQGRLSEAATIDLPPADTLTRSTSADALAGYVKLLCGDPDGARTCALRALAAAVHEGPEPWIGTAAASLLALLSLLDADPRGALEWCTQARSVQQQQREAGVRWPIGVIMARSHMLLDDLAAADEELERCRRLAEDLDSAWALLSQHVAAVEIDTRAGRWDAALAKCAALLDQARVTGVDVLLADARCDEASICIHRGRLDEAATALSAVEHDIARGIAVSVDRLVVGRADLMCARGATDEAIDLLTQTWGVLRSMPAFRRPSAEVGNRLVRLLVDQGDHDTARTIADTLPGLTSRMGPSARSLAAACRALAHGDAEAALAAAGLARTSADQLVRLQVLEITARVVDDDRSVPLLQDALAVATSLGARRDEARIRAALRVRGARSVMGRVEVVGSGWSSLTQSEREVAHLVAEGLANREIAERRVVSVRTVETQMAAIRAKLGAVRRSEIAAAARASAARRR